MAKAITIFPSDLRFTEGPDGDILFSGQDGRFKVAGEEVAVCVPGAKQVDPDNHTKRHLNPVTVRTFCNGYPICTGGLPNANAAYVLYYSPSKTSYITSPQKVPDPKVYVE